MQPFQVPKANIPTQQRPKPIPGRGVPPGMNKPNIPKPTFPQQTPEINKVNFPPEESAPKKETPEETPKPEIKEVKRTIEKNPEDENESPEEKHPPETDHQRKFSFSPNNDPEEAPQKIKVEPPRRNEEYKDETRVSQAQLQGDLKEMRDLQANFGGFDIAVDDNDEEEEDLENENYGNEDDDYVRVESNDVTEQKKYRRPQDEKPDYEEIDNTPPNFGYGQGNQDADNNSADKIEDQDQEGQDQEELVVEEGDPYPHKVEKEFVLLNDTKISTLGDGFETSPNILDPEQLPPPKNMIKPFENEPPKILETKREDEEDDLPPPRKNSFKPRYQNDNDNEANEEPETKPPMAKPFNPTAGKPGPFQKPFVPPINRPMSQAIPSNVHKTSDPEGDRHHKSISEPIKALETKPQENREPTTSIKPSHLEETADPNLYAAYKKLELELEKERKKNSSLEKELDRLVQENISLKEKMSHQHSHHHSGDHSQIKSRLDQKDEEINVLKEELNHVIENSRLVNDHSNKIISENARFKEETDQLVNQLSEDKNKLVEELYSLKNHFHRDYQSKLQSFESKINSLESQLKFYQENFNLVEEQLRVKDEAFNKLAMANSEYEKMMEEMVKSPYKSHTSHLQMQPIVSNKSRDRSEETIYHLSTMDRPQEEHKVVTIESKPETKKEEPPKQSVIQNPYPVAESGGTEHIENYHSHTSPEDMQDINVRFDSVRYDEELEKPPTKVNHPPKTQAQNNPFNQPQQQQFQHSQQTQQQQQHQTISQAFHQNSPPKQDESSHDNMMPPPMGQQSNNNSNMANTASLMAAPQYRMPHKKGADTQQRKPIPFTPQNVQIISGKAIDNTNPLTETEEDKRETPRRENASNASTPTREESIKQQTQQAPPQTKEFNQPVISHPQIHTQTHTQNHPQPQPGKVINLAQKPKIGKNPFADPEDANLGGDSHRDEPELNPEHLITPPTRTALQQQQQQQQQQQIPLSNVQPFETKPSSINKPKDTKFDPTPKSKKIVLTQNIITNDAAEDFFDQLGHGPTQQQGSNSSRGINTFNLGGQRAFDDSHKNLSLHGEDPSHRESSTSVHSVVSNKTDDIKPNPKVIPVAVKKKMTSMANMFE